MEDRITELEHRVDDLAINLGGLIERFDEDGDRLPTQKDINELDNSSILELQERLTALEKAVATLSNTLHVIDATSLLALYSLIQTNNLRQPTFTNNQDIIDSGCSDAINRMLKTVVKVNAAEAARKSKQTKAIKDMMEKKDGKDETEGR